jgi:hypothetical protein
MYLITYRDNDYFCFQFKKSVFVTLQPTGYLESAPFSMNSIWAKKRNIREINETA